MARLLGLSQLGDQAAATVLGSVSKTLVQKARRLANETLTAAQADEYREAFDNVVLHGERGTAWDDLMIYAARWVRKAKPRGGVTEDPRTWNTDAVRRKYFELVLDDVLGARRDVRAGKVSPAVVAVVRDFVLGRLADFSLNKRRGLE